MRNDEQEKQILQKLIKRFGTCWEAQAKKAMERLYEQIEAGTSITKAVATLREEYGELFKLDGLQDMMTEAACYGYGIMPSVLTSTQHAAWGAALATSWDASGMTLSEKIHGAGVKMRGEIIRTMQTQMQRNQTWLSAARALYDGYSGGKNAFTGGKDIIQEQEIPKYLQKVLIATNDSQTAVAQRQALQNINRLARNGAPNKALQAAYHELLETVKEENDKAMYKAVRTAIHEKSRYVAERIARTEMARAYADGFIAKISKDEDIVAVKFKLSGRHPTFDICDMYAKADMFGLGKGIYPKDKLPPLPIHPHCLCHYSEIIEGEVDMKKSADHVRAAGDTWLNGLSESQRRQVLGVNGVEAWQSGKDWRKYMRGYAGLKDVGSRLAKLTEPLASRKTGEKVTIEQKTIDKLATFSYPGMSRAQSEIMRTRQKELLTFAMRENNSNEVAFLLDEKLRRIEVVMGDEKSVDVTAMMNHSGRKDLQILHNHPHGSSFSMDDIRVLFDYDDVRGISLITNEGRIETLQKTSSYNKMKANKIAQDVFREMAKQDGIKKHEVIECVLTNLMKEKETSWKK